MNDIARWFLQNAGAGLAACALACLLLAFLLVMKAFRTSRPKEDFRNSRFARDTAKRLMLDCGDAKALASLAIQRHMADAEFLRHLSQLPCYEELVPHFSETLKTKFATEPVDSGGRPTLAAACLEDIERLERGFSSGSGLLANRARGPGQDIRSRPF